MKGGTESCAAGIVDVGDVAADGDAAAGDAEVGTGVGSEAFNRTNSNWDGPQGPSQWLKAIEAVFPAERSAKSFFSPGKIVRCIAAIVSVLLERTFFMARLTFVMPASRGIGMYLYGMKSGGAFIQETWNPDFLICFGFWLC